MLSLNNNIPVNRQYINRLVELVDTEFNDTGFKWHRFVSTREKDFVISNTERAKRDSTWVPSNNVIIYACAIIGRLEYRLNDIRIHYLRALPIIYN